MAKTNGSTTGTVDINNIAMLVQLSRSMPMTNKKEKTVTLEINEQKRVDYRMGRYYKSLFDPHDLAPIQSVVSAAKQFHYNMTSPWLDDGRRLLMNVGHTAYITRFRELKAEFNACADDFANDYPIKLARLPQLLGDLFDPNDYPDQSEIRKRFNLDIRFMAVGKGDHFVVNSIASETMREMQAQVEKDKAAGVKIAMTDSWERVYDRVQKLVEGLTSYSPAYVDEHGAKRRASNAFHASLITNVRDLVDVMPIINPAQDPKFAEIAEKMRENLTMFPSETLKEDEGIRSIVAAKAQEILNQVSQYI